MHDLTAEEEIAAETLLSLSSAPLLAWQEQNGGHTYYRSSVLRGICNVLRKKTDMEFDLMVSPEMILIMAKKIERYHFHVSKNIGDYMNAKQLVKTIDNYHEGLFIKK